MFAQTAMKQPPDLSTAAYGEEREKSHRNMLSAVAHDLKTPLASIIGSLEVYTVMHQKLPAEKQVELIRVALQEAHRLDNFMTNILDMAKLESNAVTPKQETVEIGPLLRNCFSRMEHNLNGANIDLVDSWGIKTTTDSALLCRVINLVVDNALKYGGTPPVIRIEYGKEAIESYIRIRDNGTGIPADQCEVVFNKYSRLDRRDQKPVSGLGLGLPIARKIMDLLKGKITAATHDEGGTVITLLLPA